MKASDIMKIYDDLPEALCYSFVSSVYQWFICLLCTAPSLDIANIFSTADMSLGS